MKTMKSMARLLLVFMMLFGVLTPANAVASVLDGDELRGPWDVHLGKLVEKVPASSDGTMSLPGYLSHPETGADIPAYAIGYATLYLQVEVPEELKSTGKNLRWI